MKTVLIVEDEKMIRQGIHIMIERSGVPVENIIECSNGEKALEILSGQEIDVMFTDIRMPKMDGIELVNRIQSMQHMPLTVAVSGYDDFSYAVEMLRNGVREYILKPVERDKIREILEKLNEELENKKEQKENAQRIGYHQIKQMMLSNNMTEEEIRAVEKQYGEMFAEQFGGSYHVCLRNAKERSKDGMGGYILLESIEDNDIFIVPDSSMEKQQGEAFTETGYVGISSLHNAIGELGAAYREALAARKRAFMEGRGHVYYEEPARRIPKELIEIAAKLTTPEAGLQRVQLLGTGHTDRLEKAFEDLFFSARSGRIAPESFEKCIKDFLDEAGRIYKNAISDDTAVINRLKHIWSEDCLEDYAEKFMDYVLGLHEKINREFMENATSQKMREALEYIHAHYAEELNMAVVSNHISMNYSLFSCSFKEYTGKNFVRYLREIRLEKAKRLLVETDDRINEISQQIGYDNEKHFMKSFKQYVGVSPSEYRKNTKI